MRKNIPIIAVITVLLVGLMGAGLVMAQDSSKPANTLHQLFLTKLAAKLGVEQTKLQESISEARSQAVDAAVQQGLIPAERAQKLKESGKMMFGPGGMPKGGHRMMFGQSDFCEILGMTKQELKAELKAGKTVAQIAEAKGMTMDQLKEKWLANAKEKLDNKVAQGRLTAQQAQDIFTKLQNKDLGKLDIMLKMNNPKPFRGSGKDAPSIVK